MSIRKYQRAFGRNELLLRRAAFSMNKTDHHRESEEPTRQCEVVITENLSLYKGNSLHINSPAHKGTIF